MGKEEIEESTSTVGLLKRCTTGGSGGSTRWVDGSEVDSESPPWSLFGDEEIIKQGYGSVRRRLVKKPKRVDSFDVEAMEISVAHGTHHRKEASLLSTLALAFQTLGVVYGDMGTSPLYVFSGVFSKVPITSEVDVLGALSIVLYTIALIPLMKYVFIVLKANDNGEGGTFALYSLICRYANVNLLPNRQPADEHISSFKLKLPTPELERALNIKEVLERKSSLKTLVLLLVLMGTSMIIGDGILTPAISVMSAVSGLQGRIPGFGTNALVITSIIILGALFSIQRYGSSKVGFTFAPALALWFFSLGSIGVYNLLKHDVTVLRALNPAYIYLFFQKNSINGWSALGGCVLCITGAEAMFADLGHFSVKSIQIAFTSIVFPCLLLAYFGQAAYFMKYPNSSGRIFYDSVPDGLFWPVFGIATVAAIIASQAMISASFSCVKQAMALGCFPRLKIIHTSKRHMGQIYIPVINWFLMIMCMLVVAAFKSTTDIANAYVLKGISDALSRGKKPDEMEKLVLDLWKTNMRHQHSSEVINKDIISHFVLRLVYCRTEELRKWFLSIESTLFRYRFRDEAPEVQRALMAEFDLPYKAVSNADYESVKDKLNQVARAIGQPITTDAIFYKVPFEEVPELVAGRRVFIQKGKAYIAMNQVVSLVITQFRSHLSKALVLTNRKWTSMIREQEKDRLIPIIEALFTSYLGPDYSQPREHAEISLKDIDRIAKSSFPLCMHHLFEKLREDHHLKHGGRMQLGLFLKGVGLKLDDALAFWRAEFSRKVGAERFDKEYAYGIRHNYGKEGKRTDYTPYSCQKIISSAPGVGDHHGCPYRHFSEENLRAALTRMRVGNRALEDVIDKVRNRHYQLACTLTFEAVHGSSCDAGVNHPNQYYNDSRRILESQNSSSNPQGTTASM